VRDPIGNAPSTSDFVLRLCAVRSWVSKSFTSGFLNDAEMHAKCRVQTERKGLDGVAAGPAVSTTSGA
jgi:hypothetical protein